MEREIKKVHIITPVKDAIDFALQTAKAILSSEQMPAFIYTIYDDYSEETNSLLLKQNCQTLGCNYIHLKELTSKPSPNYLTVLQYAQKKALEDNADLIIVESDVVVKPHTLATLIQEVSQKSDCGLGACVTVDKDEKINYPYEYAANYSKGGLVENKHLSFCCTLLTLPFLQSTNFKDLDESKNWHDVTISRISRNLNFQNYLFTSLPVWHRPHGSRPWKQLKYKNPLKYYWRKFTKGLDKI